MSAAFQVGDRVRAKGRTVSRVLGVASSGRVLIASEASGRSRMVEAGSLRLVTAEHEIRRQSND